MENGKFKRKDESDILFYLEDIRLYDRVKFILETNIEPLLFKFLEFKAGFTILVLEINEKHASKTYSFLNKKIRKSDFLIKIFEDKNFYLIIAQDTKSEGAAQFSNRLIKDLAYILSPDYKIDSSMLKISSIIIEKEYIDAKRLSYEVIKNIIIMNQSNKMWVKIKRF